MEWERIEAAWQHYSQQAQRRWDRLSQQDIAATAGNRGRLLDGIARQYGVSSSEAERQLAQWQSQQVAPHAEPAGGAPLEDVEEAGSGYCDDETVPEAPRDAVRR